MHSLVCPPLKTAQLPTSKGVVRMSRTPKAPWVKVQVTEEQIKGAVQRDSGHCMIAEATRAAFPDAKAVSVDLQTVRFTDPRRGLRYTYLTPRPAIVALVKWDQGDMPEPFNFTLRGGHVTRSGSNSLRRPLSPKEQEQRKRAAAAGRKARLNRARLVVRKNDGHVPDRVGGRTPPLMRKDNVPLARRRAFGLRALEA